MNIKECHVILDQSQRRISYVHLCKNTNKLLCIAVFIKFEETLKVVVKDFAHISRIKI